MTVRLVPVCLLMQAVAVSSGWARSEGWACAWEREPSGHVETYAKVVEAGSFAVVGCTGPWGCTVRSVDWDRDTVEEPE